VQTRLPVHGRHRRALHRLLAVLGAATMLLATFSAPASAASGGGCRDSSNSIAHVGVCISWRPSDKVMLPDIYVNRVSVNHSTMWWHVEVHRADGVAQVNANYTHRGTGHYGPTRHRGDSFGAGGTVRAVAWFQSMGDDGRTVNWAGPFYSPWLNYP
jgi:hypothetical protein